MSSRCCLLLLLLLVPATPGAVAEEPTRQSASTALRKAVAFQHDHVARHGGYVYAQSSDLKLREGEGVVGEDTIWVQPPGTPTIGEAYLDAYDATRDRYYLEAASDVGEALLRGQLESGGWTYRIEFGPEREKYFYRTTADGEPRDVQLPKKARNQPAGWETWSRQRINANITTLDDETTQAAARFLCRLDKAKDFKDERLHAATLYALKSLVNAQYPNGAWSANYNRFPHTPPSEKDYPILKASFPESTPKAWPKDFTGCYVLNDDLIPDILSTLLLAYDVYQDQQYLASARRAGDFLLLAQMPDPQPAWAQQYDKQMQPVWCRAFEPPAITGGESQGVLESLLLLYQRTGDKKYLEPIPRAIAYLRKSQLPDGRLARFYELKTNRPIYFTRVNGKHEPTYSDKDITSGYGYIVDSNLDQIERRYQQVLQQQPASTSSSNSKGRGQLSAKRLAEVERVIVSLDQRGAWVERGRLKHHKVEPASGIISSRTFATNVRILSDYLRSKQE